MTPLGRLIAEMIAAEGPISVERYMALCLSHPRHGYYLTRDPFGAAGDFTTAPEISQVFGELLGLWAAQVWIDMGSPAPVRLVELGPGRGTLMADALRAARAAPGFLDALHVELVETSPVLAAAQRRTLAEAHAPVVWRTRAEEVAPGPAIVLANEFFDALPVRQFTRAQGAWRERLVGLAEDGRLRFGLAGAPTPGFFEDAPEGATLEVGAQALEQARLIARRVVGEGGAALIVDYGPARSGFGETLQALRGHAFADPLAAPGEADLTAHVDFSGLARAAAAEGAAVFGPTTQRVFLLELGLGERAATLTRGAIGAQITAIEAAVARLTEPGPRGMGELFKVLCFARPGLAPPGFLGIAA